MSSLAPWHIAAFVALLVGGCSARLQGTSAARPSGSSADQHDDLPAAYRVFGRNPGSVLDQIVEVDDHDPVFEVMLTSIDADLQCEDLLRAMAAYGFCHVGALGASGDRGLFDGLSFLFARAYTVQLAITDADAIRLVQKAWLERRVFGLQEHDGPEALWEYLTPVPECREAAGLLPRAVVWKDEDLLVPFWKQDAQDLPAIEVLTNIQLATDLTIVMSRHGYTALGDNLGWPGTDSLGAFVMTFGRERHRIARDVHKQEALDVAARLWVHGRYVAVDFTILSFNLYALADL